MPAARRLVQRAVAAAVAERQTRSRLQKAIHAAEVPARSRVVQRRVSARLLSIDVGAEVAEEADESGPAVLGGEVERSEATVLCAPVGVGAACQEELGQRGVAMQSGHVKGSEAIRVAAVDVNLRGGGGEGELEEQSFFLSRIGFRVREDEKY